MEISTYHWPRNYDVIVRGALSTCNVPQKEKGM